MVENMQEENNIRLQKYLASCGIASRRKCEEYILEGLVEVNGEKVFKLGTKINPKVDKIKFKGREIKKTKEYVYILLNKPIRLCNNCKRSI